MKILWNTTGPKQSANTKMKAFSALLNLNTSHPTSTGTNPSHDNYIMKITFGKVMHCKSNELV